MSWKDNNYNEGTLYCPKCDKELSVNYSVGKYEIIPCNCGFTMCNEDRKVPCIVPITQKELDEYYKVLQLKEYYDIKAIYKCQMCKETISKHTDILENLSIDDIDKITNTQLFTVYNTYLEKYIPHQCNEDTIGIAQLIGIKKIKW